MLAAEIERCRTVTGRRVNGVDPVDEAARRVLAEYGFHTLLELGGGKDFGPSPLVRSIVSGGGPESEPHANASEKTFQVADITTLVFSETVADRVHSALNEATENVISHAYRFPQLIKTPQAILAKWWASGVCNPAEKEAIFFVYDQGSTIPKTAPLTADEFFRSLFYARVLDGVPFEREHEILAATIAQRRTATLKTERGKGLAHMIGLIDEAMCGSVTIYSGWGYYMYTRTRDHTGPSERSGPLACEFPGTLVVWKMNGA